MLGNGYAAQGAVRAHFLHHVVCGVATVRSLGGVICFLEFLGHLESPLIVSYDTNCLEFMRGRHNHSIDRAPNPLRAKAAGLEYRRDCKASSRRIEFGDGRRCPRIMDLATVVPAPAGVGRARSCDYLPGNGKPTALK